MIKQLFALFVALLPFAGSAQPPNGGKLIESLNIAGIAKYANDRSGDLVKDYNDYTSKNLYSDPKWGEKWIERSHAAGASVVNGEYVSTLEDGYYWHGNSYDRSECYWGGFSIPVGVIHDFEWQGYFPQTLLNQVNNASGYADCGVIMQIHGNDGFPPPFAFNIQPDGSITFYEHGSHGNGAESKTVMIPAGDKNLLNVKHSVKLYLKEGPAGSGAFIKVVIDGVLKYKREDGKQVGQTLGADWPKFCTLYDWGAAVVQPSNTTRDKKFSQVTQSFNLYTLTDTTGISGGIHILPVGITQFKLYKINGK